VSYRLRHPQGKPKSSIIASLLDLSTPDKKEITLKNGIILQPLVHDVKREKMYGGGACGQLTNPLSVWMKMEQCILLVRFTSNFKALDKANNDKDVNNDNNVMILTTMTTLIFLMISIQYTIHTGCVYNVLSLSISSLYSKSTLLMIHHQQVTPTNA
jgi:hypothetical protein